MKFTFSIRAALKKSWHLFAKHPYFFIAITLVMAVFSIFSRQHEAHTPLDIALTILVVIASILWSYVWLSVSLSAVDGHEDLLRFGCISQHMPSIRQFFTLIGVGLLMGIIIGFGFILLIIPGIYFLIRLSFANLALVDRHQGVWKSITYSWHLVRGKIFWTVFLVALVHLGLMILGVVALVIGLLIAYPIGMLLMAQLYRELTVYSRNLEAVVAEVA
jgi:hypothetical protein